MKTSPPRCLRLGPQLEMLAQVPSSNQKPKCLPAKAQLVFFSIFVGPTANTALLLKSSSTTPRQQTGSSAAAGGTAGAGAAERGTRPGACCGRGGRPAAARARWATAGRRRHGRWLWGRATRRCDGRRMPGHADSCLLGRWAASREPRATEQGTRKAGSNSKDQGALSNPRFGFCTTEHLCRSKLQFILLNYLTCFFFTFA